MSSTPDYMRGLDDNLGVFQLTPRFPASAARFRDDVGALEGKSGFAGVIPAKAGIQLARRDAGWASHLWTHRGS